MSSNKKKKNWAEHGLEDWGSYMAAKKEKLEDQFQEEANKEFQDATSLFAGVAIFVNGYTTPCADELKRLMMAHGGLYHHYMRPRITTHIIASNLPYSKIVMYRKSQNPLPICRPEWITDSLKAQKLLDWRPYVLYSNCTKTQPRLAFSGLKASDSSLAATEKTVTQQDKKVSTEIVPTSHGTVDSDVKASSSLAKPGKSGAPMCTKNSEFLSEFYNNSRLHHISTMGATFKDYVNELRLRNDGTFPGLARLTKATREMNLSRPKCRPNESDSDDDLFDSPSNEPTKTGLANSESVIMHIDMDCFFVSVGLRNRPDLKGLPVAVTHARGNNQTSRGTLKNADSNENDEEEDYGSMSEVASCSYEAREAGVKNGMFLGQALKLCPNIKTIKYDFDGYKEVSYALYDTVASYTLLIEAVSCDEMYADITMVLRQSNLTPLEFASIIRNEIREKTRCPVSTGFGSNKLQARLATRKAKPDGQFHLDGRDCREYIGSMVVRDLPGVGYSTAQLLNKMNVRTCSELRDISLGILQKEFGKKTGEMLYNMCRGIDNSKLTIEHVRKSVSAEVNYGIRFDNADEADDFLRQLSREVCERLQKANSKGRSITLKLMVRARDAPKEALKFMGHGICDNFTKSKNLIAPVDDPIIVTREVLGLWNQMQQPCEDIRGVGIQISRLESSRTRTGSMMNFFSKQPAVEKQRDSVKSTSATSNDPRDSGKGEKSTLNNQETRDPKSGSLKAFLVPKSRLGPTRGDLVNGSERAISLKSSNIEEIDETVLAELPEDIRREILGSRGQLEPRPSTESLEIDRQPAPSTSGDQIFDHDQSSLSELPEDIRNEILVGKTSSSSSSSSSAKLESKKLSNSRQTMQEKFYKHAKPSSRKSEKAEMPPIEDIDMSVLIELPDDIRNEIMNEYRAKKRALDESETIKIPEKRSNDQGIVLEHANLSFSQVDPEFLAALSEDVRNDVEMYCMVKKKEKLLKVKKSSEPMNGAAVSSTIAKNRNTTKLNKKNVRLPKVRNKNANGTAKIASDRRNVPPDVGRKIEQTGNDGNRRRFFEGDVTVDADVSGSLEQREEIISHHSSFTGKKARTEEQEMLTSLVNYLFTLPLRQVKMQIQTWISNSDDVNEIDLLSLATYLSMLPKKKHLEDLHILLKTMHRCITKTGSCVWHETYRRTVHHVQRYMQIEYNSKMMLPTIECDLPGCEKNLID